MGACLRKGPEIEKKRAIIIDEDLRKCRKDMEKQIILLLLGAGDSGKSTIFKQIRIIHLEGFDEEERLTYKLAVIGNLINSIQCLIRGAASLDIPLEESNSKAAENILRLSGLNDLTVDIRHDIVKIATDKSLKKTMRQTNIYIPDSAPHFLKHVSRVLSDDFVPTVDDIKDSYQIYGNN